MRAYVAGRASEASGEDCSLPECGGADETPRERREIDGAAGAMAECVILIGLPGAGKTTFYNQRLSTTHVHVSKDRFPRSARDKQSRQDAALRAGLNQGRSVAVDNTNVSIAERAGVIALARALGARIVGVYIVASTREAVARNERRQGPEKVPKVAIFTKAKRLEAPMMAEGFDELRSYRVTADGKFEEAPITPEAAPANPPAS